MQELDALHLIHADAFFVTDSCGRYGRESETGYYRGFVPGRVFLTYTSI
jgi:hypothetical protein